jgi:predicted flap endonuclease-1-like 5' DNA nuclease
MEGAWNMASIEAIEGIGAVYAIKLREAGVRTVEKLLEVGATKKGRVELAAATGISEKLILTWANHADLFRIKGVSSQYSELLEAAGVDTVVELGNRKAENLHAKMLEVNEKKKLVRRPPSLKMVESWVKQAGKLPRVMTY